MKNFVQRGDVITAAAPADLKSGDFVAIGALAGFAQTDALADQDVAIVVQGVFEATVTATGIVSVGTPVYSDGTTLTTSEPGNTKVGYTVSEASVPFGGSTALIKVRLG